MMKFSKRLLRMSVLACAGLLSAAATAEQSAALHILEIKDNRGGELRPQASRIAQLRQSGQSVRITGDVCYSTCTMYLGLAQTCVSPRTVFGFHAPTSYGRRLDPQTFETASRIIAEHYPPVLQDWYMAYGRHKYVGLLKVTGAELIRIGGARPCPTVG